jgi:fructose-bisphosphate aldolase class II
MLIVQNYTQPEEVYAYEELSKISPRFTIAAAFETYTSIQIDTENFEKFSRFVQNKFNTGHNPDFVFHGGSGSTLEEIRRH